MFASSVEATREKDELRSASTTNGGQFVTTHGVRPMHKSFVGNLATALPFRLLVALDSAKDPDVSYSIMSIVLERRRLWNYADTRESGLMTALIPKMRVLFAVQVRKTPWQSV